jgi:mono/diheme cytochrome c family protein
MLRMQPSIRLLPQSLPRISYDLNTPLIFKCTWILIISAVFFVSGCGPSLPPSKPLSQLTPQEASGYSIYASRCGGCHYANNQAALHGPGLQGLYKKKYLSSGAPANDDRVTAVILHGRNMMPAFGNTIAEQELADLLAYLHTL